MAKNIHAALAAIMRDTESITKGRTNTQQGFKYRGIDDVMNGLHAAFSAHGVFISVGQIVTVLREQHTSAKGGILFYTINDYQFVFTAEDGTSIAAWGRGEAMDSGDKASNKAISIALKYALLQMFLIPTEEDKDPDGHTPAPVQRQQPVPQQPSAKQPIRQPSDSERIYDEAITRVEFAKSMEELATIYSQYPSLADNQDFLNACGKRKKELATPAKSAK